MAAIHNPAQIPINKVLSSMVHRPRLKLSTDAYLKNRQAGYDDYYPLYARSDKVGYDKRSPQWFKALDKQYNSPRNIRGLVLSMSGVYVEYWSAGSEEMHFHRYQWRSYDSVPEWVSHVPSSKLGGMISETVKNCASKGEVPILNIHDYHLAMVTNHISKAFNQDWVLSNLEYFYIDELLILEFYKNPGMVKRIRAAIKNYPIDKWTTPQWDKALLTGYINGDCGLVIHKELDVYLKQIAYQGAAIYPLPLKTCMRYKDRPESQVATFVTSAIGYILTGGNGTDNFDNFMLKGFPRLKYIGVLDTDFNGCKDALNIKAPNPSENGNALYNLTPFRQTLSPAIKGGFFVTMPGNLYRASFSTYKSWLFDSKFLIDYFNRYATKAKELELVATGIGAMIKRNEKAEAVEAEATQMHAPVSNENVEGAEEYTAPETLMHEPVSGEEDSEAQEYGEPTADSKEADIDPNATDELEVLWNSGYLMGENIVRAAIRTSIGVYGVKKTRRDISNFTPKGQKLYTELLNDTYEKMRTGGKSYG